jgi:hypothetical protein
MNIVQEDLTHGLSYDHKYEQLTLEISNVSNLEEVHKLVLRFDAKNGLKIT